MPGRGGVNEFWPGWLIRRAVRAMLETTASRVGPHSLAGIVENGDPRPRGGQGSAFFFVPSVEVDEVLDLKFSAGAGNRDRTHVSCFARGSGCGILVFSGGACIGCHSVTIGLRPYS